MISNIRQPCSRHTGVIQRHVSYPASGWPGYSYTRLAAMLGRTARLYNHWSKLQSGFKMPFCFLEWQGVGPMQRCLTGTRISLIKVRRFHGLLIFKIRIPNLVKKNALLYIALNLGPLYLIWLPQCIEVTVKDLVKSNPQPPEQKGRHFPDDIFKRIFVNENVRILIKMSLKFLTKAPIDKTPVFGQVMAWHRASDKPLPEAMLTLLTDAYMRH